MVAAQHLTRTGDTGLNLVSDEQNVVSLAEVIAFLQITFVRYINTGFALDRFNEETANHRIFQSLG